MQVGDLVKMKYEMWWKLRSMPNRQYTGSTGIVMETSNNAIKVLVPEMGIKHDLAEHWEKVK